MQQIPGKIFLADQRGLLETSAFQRYSTLSFGAYQHEHKGAVGCLHGINEELLAGGQRATLAAAQASYVVLLPITGAVSSQVSSGPATTIDVGEVLVQFVPAGATIEFQNPYTEELIRFLHLWVQVGAPPPATTFQFSFELAALENQLSVLVPARAGGLPFTLRMGRFVGRHETVYHLPAGAQFFAFVLAGAFEVEGRLLHEQDALALWDTAEIELEALSNDALVLVMELPG